MTTCKGLGQVSRSLHQFIEAPFIGHLDSVHKFKIDRVSERWPNGI